MKKQQLINHLIQEQIRNQILILALEKLGFDCTQYTLNISEEILTLLGFKAKPDRLYQHYFELIEKAVEDTSYYNMDEKLTKWCGIIFNKLQDIEKNGLPP
ncbi:hypothetical protein SAMN05444285_1624 [Draconibacterium orientale]|uniref:Uncharacterized protein n=1 Tax=Draconibacterium orientale TaxID=1168034 RepID=X5E4E5_9BACT|nr:hypothetical protein [Draconibacterium orientale]AHW62330.1 hypothetical protein FH5T_19805 [Draconibacterium orientale]SEU15774.1 hypothetical protein SAMN05444285_1624 [Draconibacterium orientale]